MSRLIEKTPFAIVLGKSCWCRKCLFRIWGPDDRATKFDHQLGMMVHDHWREQHSG